MTSASGPFVSIKPGGPLQGVVTISANTETDSPPLVVDATWKPLDGDRRSLSQTVDEYNTARNSPTKGQTSSPRHANQHRDRNGSGRGSDGGRTAENVY